MTNSGPFYLQRRCGQGAEVPRLDDSEAGVSRFLLARRWRFPEFLMPCILGRFHQHDRSSF